MYYSFKVQCPYCDNHQFATMTSTVTEKCFYREPEEIQDADNPNLAEWKDADVDVGRDVEQCENCNKYFVANLTLSARIAVGTCSIQPYISPA